MSAPEMLPRPGVLDRLDELREAYAAKRCLYDYVVRALLGTR
jgi:hypothetical protein